MAAPFGVRAAVVGQRDAFQLVVPVHLTTFTLFGVGYQVGVIAGLVVGSCGLVRRALKDRR